MAKVFVVHPENPQPRLLRQAAEIIGHGGVVVYPTDSSYALGCAMGDKGAMERIRRIRQTAVDHEFTLVCSDLSELATYAKVDNWAYRLLKSLTPGPYTFILRATREVPKRLQNPRRRSVGIRVPDSRITQALIHEVGAPLMSSTLILPGEDRPLTEVDEIGERLGDLVEAIIDGGAGGMEPTTVLDLSGAEIVIVRRGKGDVSAFL